MTSRTPEDTARHPADEKQEPGVPGLVLVSSGPTAHLLPIPLHNGRADLGRDELAALNVPDDRVSRLHLSVLCTADGLRLIDHGSTNGVFLNGKRVAGDALAPADQRAVLRIGRTILLLVPDLAVFQSALGRPLLQDGIVVGPALAAVHEQVVALARAGQRLFLCGESGTGKEIAARLYHEAGPRKGGPFVAVNCATIPKDLAERLFFGAVRGAYSGAVADAEGFLQAASGGTLFLDEVAELDLAVQAKLLRALETQSVVPLGGTRALPIDVGLCAASLTDLRQAVAQREFRQDLYYRIGLPAVHMPPLRERSEEVPALIALTLQRTSGLAAAPSLIETCLLRPWPGNVRELCAAVGAAAALSAAAGAATVSDRRLAAGAGLPLGAASPAGPPPAAVARAAPPEADRLFAATAEALGLSPRTARKLFQPAMLAELHRRAEQEGLDESARHGALRALAAQSLLALLQARGYRRRQVAADLGLGRTTLFRLIDDLGLPQAATLDATDIARARAQAGGDMDAAALLLRVSPTALRQRVAALERSG